MDNQIQVGGNAGDAIVVKGLTKSFKDEFAVQDLSFNIPKGKIFGFIGPSGCGKTTTVRLLTGIYHPTGGEAWVLGVHPKDFTPRTRERIGYLPQLFVLYPDLTVWENINFTASLYGMSMRRRREVIKNSLEFVELTPHQHKLARDISGGMQRRLSLASTLVHNPELVFLDEPTAGIDPVLRQKFWEHFREMQSEGKTMFVTTQYVGEAAYCDYVGVMAEGRLLIVDTPAGLRKKAFGGDVIDLQVSEFMDYQTIQRLADLPFVINRPSYVGQNITRVIVDDASTALPQIMEWAQSNRLEIESAKEFTPPFDDVFVILVQKAVPNA